MPDLSITQACRTSPLPPPLTSTSPNDPPNQPGLSVVVGLGRSGQGAARLLHQQGEPVCLVESRHTPELDERAEALRRQGIAVELGMPLAAATLNNLNPHLRRVIVSPGIRWDHPVLQQLRDGGVPVQGELVPAWQASQALGLPWIGITGTNGKTTVTHLVSHVLEKGGMRAPMAGNVGRSAAELLLSCRQGTTPLPQWLVVEVSSYQIEAAPELAPQIGIWTTLTPDHLERHGTLEAYRAIKRSLLERCRLRLLNADDPDLRAHAHTWEHATWVSARGREALPDASGEALWIEAGRVWQRNRGQERELMAADALAMPGAHNRQNMLLAAAACLAAGLEPPQLEAGFRSFAGVPHRLERIREHGGLIFYNDSKATNYDAAEVALQALDGPLVVLAGGEPKRGDSSGWLSQLQRQAKAVVLYGAAQAEFQVLLSGAGFAGQVRCCPGLAEAVPEAAALATQQGCRAVLLSPACASFDQYSDFEARGAHFRQLVEQL